MTTDVTAIARAHATLSAGSASFALATRLLSRPIADRAAVIYAWCRRADDAVDLCPPQDAPAAVARLRAELDQLYAGEPTNELAAFAEVIRETAIPAVYPHALLDGMAADAAGTPYATVDELVGYCYQVASTVGLMMCHVFGIGDDSALRHAAHLGIAMQLTNICRDVAEDWERGRLYVPDELCPGLRSCLGEPLPTDSTALIAQATAALLARADDFYRSGDRGIPALPWRAGLAVRSARSIYAAIGRVIAAHGCDPRAGRAIVPRARKLALVGAASLRQLATTRGPRSIHTPRAVLEFPDGVLPL